MLKFKSFLHSTKNLLASQTPLRIVLGNTSADMDSVVGSLGLAYYLSLKTGQSWTPVVNCARD